MIVYIASYPRSGNSWLQNLLGNQFKRLSVDIHQKVDDPSALEQWTLGAKRRYNIDIYPLEERDSIRYGALSNWIVAYRSAEGQSFKCILPGCLKLLNNKKTREILSMEQETYFLKTHLFPYSAYLPGEYIIQIVRNPGACLWSYYNFRRDVKNTRDDLTALIQGNPGFGNWSQYHIEWIQAARNLGAHYLQVRYEDLFGSELEFCKKLQKFFNLPIVSEALQSFDFYHDLHPTLAREGKADGWEKYFSKDQLELLWGIHNQMMTHFGYQEPNYNLGLEEAN
jgi:hypothetical protein